MSKCLSTKRLSYWSSVVPIVLPVHDPYGTPALWLAWEWRRIRRLIPTTRCIKISQNRTRALCRRPEGDAWKTLCPVSHHWQEYLHRGSIPYNPWDTVISRRAYLSPGINHCPCCITEPDGLEDDCPRTQTLWHHWRCRGQCFKDKPASAFKHYGTGEKNKGGGVGPYFSVVDTWFEARTHELPLSPAR